MKELEQKSNQDFVKLKLNNYAEIFSQSPYVKVDNNKLKKKKLQSSVAIFNQIHSILPNINEGKKLTEVKEDEENKGEVIDRENERDKEYNEKNRESEKGKEKGIANKGIDKENKVKDISPLVKDTSQKRKLRSNSTDFTTKNSHLLFNKARKESGGIFIEKKIIPEEENILKLDNKKYINSIQNGYLYTFRCATKNRLKKLYFILKPGLVILYNDSKLDKTKGLINLNNCHLKQDILSSKIGDSIFYSFHLYHNIGHETFYCNDKEEYNTWLKSFQNTLEKKEVENISNYFLIVSKYFNMSMF